MSCLPEITLNLIDLEIDVSSIPIISEIVPVDIELSTEVGLIDIEINPTITEITVEPDQIELSITPEVINVTNIIGGSTNFINWRDLTTGVDQVLTINDAPIQYLIPTNNINLDLPDPTATGGKWFKLFNLSTNRKISVRELGVVVYSLGARKSCWAHSNQQEWTIHQII